MYKENELPITSTENLGISKISNHFLIDADGTLHRNKFLVSQSSGTDDEIENMIKKYYNSFLTLKDVQSVQAIGDVRQANETDHAMMKINTVSTTGYSGYNFPTQTSVKWVIIDFDHDYLTATIGDITKALITIQMLGTIGTSSSTSKGMPLNKTKYNSNGQIGTDISNIIGNTYYNSLNFKKQVKQVKKEYCSSYISGSSVSTANFYCFLPSLYEIHNSTSNNSVSSPNKEGTQYSYFIINSNKNKFGGQEGASSTTVGQQTRSPRSSDSRYFCTAGSSNYATGSSGISLCVAI